jgi:hypothetical protein
MSLRVAINSPSEKDIRECLATVKSLHPNWVDDNPSLTLKLWHYELKHFDVNKVKQAVMEVASRSKYTPKLADVLEKLDGRNLNSMPVPIYSKDTSIDFDEETLDADIQELLKGLEFRQNQYKNKTNRNKSIQEAMSKEEQEELDSLVNSWRKGE